MVTGSSRFVGDSESASFEERFVERFVEIGTGAPPNRDRYGKQAAASLPSAITKRLKSYGHDAESRTLRQEAFLIRAHRNDGISWACERVARSIANDFPHWNITTFAGGTGAPELPEIANDCCVGQRRFVKDALRTKLIQRARIWIGLDVLLPLAGSALLLLLAGLFAGKAVHWDKPEGWLFYFLAGLLGIVAPLLLKSVQLEVNPKLIERLIAALSSEAKSTQRNNLVAATSLRMLKNFPKCIIVDDYSRLDPFTKEVLLQLMKDPPNRPIGAIFWAIFEPLETVELFGWLLTEIVEREKFCDGRYSIFSMRTMTLEEKTAVLRQRGLDEAQARWHAGSVDVVKHLVQAITKKELQRLETSWNDFATTNAEANRQRPGPIEFFKFIAINGSETESPLSDYELISIFSQKAGPFVEMIAAHYEKPNSVRRSDAEAGFQIIRQRLVEFLIEPNSVLPLRIKQLAKQIVEDSPQGVVPLDSINLFWLVYWFNRWHGDKVGNSDRLQKLQRHAIKTIIHEAMLKTEAGQRLCQQALEATRWVAFQCMLRTQIMRTVELVRKLIWHIDNLSRTEFLAREELAGLLVRISGTAWAAYAISRNVDLLTCMLDLLPDAEHKQTHHGRDAMAELQTIKFYLQLNRVPRADQMRGALRIREAMRKEKFGFNRLLDHMTLLNAEFLYHRKQIGAASEEEWQALQITIRNRWSDARYESVVEVDEQVSPLFYQNRIGYIRFLTHCREFGEAQRRILAVLQTHKSTVWRTSQRQPSLLERALLLEGLATCMDCFLSGLFSGSEDFAPPRGSEPYGFRRCSLRSPTPTQSEILEILRSLLNLEYSATSALSLLLENLAVQTSKVYLQAAIAWNEFDLEDLRDALLIRRAAFLFRATNVDPSRPDTYEGILGSLSKATEDKGINGLLSDMIVAEFFRPLNDLHQILLSRCALRTLISFSHEHTKLSLSAALDENVKFSFAAVAMLGSLRVSERDIPIIANIIEFLRSPAEVIQHAIIGLAKSRFAALIHKLLEFTRGRRNDLFDTIANLGTEFASKSEPGENDELVIYLRYHRLKRELERGDPLDWQATLAEWEGNRDHWIYGALLRDALEASESNESIVSRSLDYLRDTSKRYFSPRSTPELHLVHRLTSLMFKEKRFERSECRDLLANWIAPTLNNWSVELALRTYELLIDIDPPSKLQEHRSKHAQWNAIKLERDYLDKLRGFVERGHYWLLFRAYIDALQLYDLPYCSRNTAFLEALKRGPKAALEWLSQDERERKALSTMTFDLDGRRRILEEFVAFGDLMFKTPESDWAFVGETRQELDHECRKQLRDFFSVVAEAQTVPQILRDLIGEHRRELESWLEERPRKTI